MYRADTWRVAIQFGFSMLMLLRHDLDNWNWRKLNIKMHLECEGIPNLESDLGHRDKQMQQNTLHEQ